jgi:leucyl/phenylalanyl-tRNA--protein transferase
MLYLLDPENTEAPFPPVTEALEEPNGLLAVGGDLSIPRLLNAYRNGIFPWYSQGQPLLWWSPNPRTVLFPEKLQISRSLRKSMRNRGFMVSVDRDFPAVIRACAEPRRDTEETWITPEMIRAYEMLHQLGHAHSVEVWLDGELAGGIYGVSIGRIFFGESMFSRESDASKVALVVLVDRLSSWGYKLIDCQLHSQHLVSMGAEEIAREEFINSVQHNVTQPVAVDAWEPALHKPQPITSIVSL